MTKRARAGAGLAAAAAAAVAAAAVAVVACNSILGIDPRLVPDDAGDAVVLVDCGAASVDLGSDPHHCGRCDRDCIVGECAGGACQPFVIATNVSGPRSVLVDDTFIYWSGRIPVSLAKCPLTGCPPGGPIALTTRPAPSSNFTAEGLATDGTALYVVSTGSPNRQIARCAKTGCDAGIETIAANQPNPIGIAFGGGRLFWANELSAGAVATCDPAQCNPAVFAQDSLPRAVTTDSTYLYWVTFKNTAGQVKRCPLSGCLDGGPELLASSPGGAMAIAVADASVFWLTAGDAGPGQLLGCTASACDGGVVLATNQHAPQQLALDETNVYWTSAGDSMVLACPRSGCPSSGPIVIASGQSGAKGIAVDATSVYWANEAGGTVMRVVKP